ncbi:MAG: NAD-dependent epimerase/dehydratase family protein [Anaerolineales bacterium]|nr:NAD-dependent epimerase/dehydratase family protein [Anaerolineales bacterium]
MNLQAEYARKKILITGGAGFLGSALTRALLDLNADVAIIDNFDPDGGANIFNLNGIADRVRLIRADIQDEAALREALQGKDFLFNLAGLMSHVGSMANPFKDLAANTIGHLHLLEMCRLHNPRIRIVYTSTRQVYGRPHYLPVDESHPPAPLDNNGASKRAGEMYHIVYQRAYGMATCVLRLTNTYGERMRIKDDKLNFIGWWLQRILTEQEIQVFGDGSQVRDINYADDVVRALLLCAANPKAEGKIYNLGAEPISLLDFAKLMIEVNGGGSLKMIPFPENRKRIDIGGYYADYSLIKNEIGWSPKISLREGLARTLAFYRENKERYL